ncbi:MAG: rRNA maturation RNase YbeY [Chlamydiia bacterium]
MDISIFDNQTDIPLGHPAIDELVALVVEGEAQHVDEVAVHFVTKEASGVLHDRYFQDPSPTDCMSFPMDGPLEQPRVLGEVFVCPQVAREFVLAGGTLPLDEEIALYIIHGLLHLFGYDDIEEQDVARMRQQEHLYLDRWRTKGRSVVSEGAPA